MSPDERAARERRLTEQLEVERERRLADLEEQLHAVQSGNGRLADSARDARALSEEHGKEIRDLREDMTALVAAVDKKQTLLEGRLEKELDRVKNRIDANTGVLLAFAFTIAASAVGLALTLGGH